MFASLTKKGETQKTEGGVQKEQRNRPVYQPAVDIYENESGYVITADLPGVDEKSVDVSLENHILTLKAKASEVVTEGYKLVYAEYRVGDYERSFKLNDQVNKADIQAVLKNGVLKLVLPKAKPEVTKIPIKLQ